MRRPGRLKLASFACVSLVCVSQLSRAQSASDNGQAAATAYKEALAQYQAGDVSGSLEKMRESYRLSQRSELLYNIARLEGELGNCRASLEDYRRYTQQVPNGRYQAEATQASQQLASQCPDAAPEPEVPAPQLTQQNAMGAPAVVAPAVPPASPRALPIRALPREAPPQRPATYWTTRRVLGWSLVSAGIGAGIGAAYFFEATRDAHDSFQREVNREYAGGPPANWDLQATQHRAQTWEIALAVTGGALITGSALVLLLPPSSGGRGAARASFSVMPGAFSARWGLTF